MIDIDIVLRFSCNLAIVKTSYLQVTSICFSDYVIVIATMVSVYAHLFILFVFLSTVLYSCNFPKNIFASIANCEIII